MDKKPTFKKCISCELPERYPGCQSSCEYGIKIRKELDEWNERQFAQRHTSMDLNKIEQDRLVRVRKSHKWRKK